MTATTTNHRPRNTLWSRILDWSKALDDALDLDPAEQSAKRMARKVEDLENRIRDLERGSDTKRP